MEVGLSLANITTTLLHVASVLTSRKECITNTEKGNNIDGCFRWWGGGQGVALSESMKTFEAALGERAINTMEYIPASQSTGCLVVTSGLTSA